MSHEGDTNKINYIFVWREDEINKSSCLTGIEFLIHWIKLEQFLLAKVNFQINMYVDVRCFLF